MPAPQQVQEDMHENNKNDSGKLHNHRSASLDEIVHRHLQNENDKITEEDIRNVYVGVNPPQEETTEREKERRE